MYIENLTCRKFSYNLAEKKSRTVHLEILQIVKASRLRYCQWMNLSLQFRILLNKNIALSYFRKLYCV